MLLVSSFAFVQLTSLKLLAVPLPFNIPITMDHLQCIHYPPNMKHKHIHTHHHLALVPSLLPIPPPHHFLSADLH